MQPCLIVIDYQQDFVAGPQGFPAAKALEPVLVERIRRYRAAGGAVLFTLDTGGSSTPLPPKTLGRTLYGRVEQEKQREDLCFVKDTFGSAALLDHLRQANYPSIELAGVVSHLCVLANGILARLSPNPYLGGPRLRGVPGTGAGAGGAGHFTANPHPHGDASILVVGKDRLQVTGKGKIWGDFGKPMGQWVLQSKMTCRIPTGQKTATENIP